MTNIYLRNIPIVLEVNKTFVPLISDCDIPDEQSRVSGFHDNLIAISPETPACPYPISAVSIPHNQPDPQRNKPQTSRHTQAGAMFQSPSLSTKTEQLTPLEIRSLDGSPPQRRSPSLKPRSPSLKPRSLSPAEHVRSTNNTLVNGPDVRSTNNTLVNGQDVRSPNNTLVNGQDGAHNSTQDVRKSREGDPSRTLNHTLKRDRSDPGVISSQLSVTSSQTSVTSSQSAFNVLPTVISKPNTSGVEPLENGVETVARSNSVSDSLTHQRLSLWANKACHELKYIDDDVEEAREAGDPRETVYCNMGELGAREIMTSMQMLHELQEESQQSCSITTGCGDLGSFGSTSILAQVQALPGFEPQKKRVVLSRPNESRPRSKLKDLTLSSLRSNTRCLEVGRGDKCTPHSGGLETSRSRSASPTPSRRHLQANSTVQVVQNDMRRGSLDLCHHSPAANKTDIPSTHSASLPTSPVHKILGHGGKKVRSQNHLITLPAG